MPKVAVQDSCRHGHIMMCYWALQADQECPCHVKVHCCLRCTYAVAPVMLQVLVVGDSGLGKTTLVKTLLSTPGERLQVLWDRQASGALGVAACNSAAAVAMHNHQPVAEAIMMLWQSSCCCSMFCLPSPGAQDPGLLK